MEPDVSIQLTWPLAAYEAMQGECEFIEPVHLFMAALKFAELEEVQFREISGDSSVLKALIAERDRLRLLLNELTIKVPDTSRTIRRGLRKRIKGGHPHDGTRVIHRSGGARTLCGHAEDVARANNSTQWSTVHLIEAILKSPTEEIEHILVELGVSRPGPPPPTPILDTYGRDLSRDHHRQTAPFMDDPVCKVIYEGLFAEQPKSYLLIQKGKRSPEDVVNSLSGMFAGKRTRKRIIEIDTRTHAWKDLYDDPPRYRTSMSGLLHEANSASGCILFVQEFRTVLGFDGLPGCADLVQQWLSRGGLCIGGTDETSFHDYFEKNRMWKKLLHPIWIHDLDEYFRI